MFASLRNEEPRSRWLTRLTFTPSPSQRPEVRVCVWAGPVCLEASPGASRRPRARGVLLHAPSQLSLRVRTGAQRGQGPFVQCSSFALSPNMATFRGAGAGTAAHESGGPNSARHTTPRENALSPGSRRRLALPRTHLFRFCKSAVCLLGPSRVLGTAAGVSSAHQEGIGYGLQHVS